MNIPSQLAVRKFQQAVPRLFLSGAAGAFPLVLACKKTALVQTQPGADIDSEALENLSGNPVSPPAKLAFQPSSVRQFP